MSEAGALPPSSETGFDTRLYARFPTKGPRPKGELAGLKKAWRAPPGLRLLTEVSNNYVGLWYILTAFAFFFGAGVLALVMRVQLATPLAGVVPQEIYNQLFTMHGSVMLFLFAVPAVEAMAVMLLPQMLGARDLPFPRLSAYAFWAYAIGGTVFFCSIFFALAPDGGWFMYPPLTSSVYSAGINADFWLLGIGFIEISAIAGAIELIVGVLRTRAPGMSMAKMPVFAWAVLIFAVMIITAFPAMILVTLLLEIERAFNWPLFDAMRGGDALLYQHLFWFFGHPEVYIIFIPGSAMVSMIVPVIAQKRLVGQDLVILAMIATGFISFGVWAHHMFSVGMPELSAGYFSAASMAVAIPAGVQVFAWIATLASGKVRASTPALFVIGGLLIFVMGGLTGVMIGMVPFNSQVHDTYFIVAHFHYVLIGGMVFPLIGAFYYWTPLVSRHPLSERVGKWVFWLMFSGLHICFLPMHLVGLMGMPRRVNTYLPEHFWDLPNLISTVGAFVMAAGVLLLVIDGFRRFRFSVEDSAGNVFGGGTIEWLPNGLYSVRSIPVVTDREPLWADPRLSDNVGQGRYFLPNSATGRRESLITSTMRAEPQYLQIMPGPSVWPLLAAIFTAGFFLLLTMKAMALSALCGVLMIVSIVRWLWDTDRPIEQRHVDVGAGIMLPTYATGPQSHGWWAMVILDIVMGMIFLMAVFSYLYLFGIHPEWWRIAAPMGAVVPGLALLALAGGLAWVSRPVLARSTSGPALSALLILTSATLLALALWIDFRDWWDAGLRGPASAQGASVYVLQVWQMVMIAGASLMALYYLARFVRGLVTHPVSATLEPIRLFLLYAAGQGTVVLLLPRLVPGLGI